MSKKHDKLKQIKLLPGTSDYLETVSKSLPVPTSIVKLANTAIVRGLQVLASEMGLPKP